jgi:hypothetical protein
MKKQYIVEGDKILIESGKILLLTEDQAKARMTCLKPLNEPGTFEVINPVQFKHGEIIGFVNHIIGDLHIPTIKPLEETV